MRPHDADTKWNYELALRERAQGSGSGDPGQQSQSPSAESPPQSENEQQPRGSLGREQAEQILDNAARDERDVQSRSQDRNRSTTPPGGKDW
jgi:Ca-activated chloride channel family protein